MTTKAVIGIGNWTHFVAVLVLVSAYPALARDCNGNGHCDIDDIAMGRSGDCNENRIPDECDVAPRAQVFTAGQPFDTDNGILAGNADLNGDLLPDLVATRDHGFLVALNDGNGAFPAWSQNEVAGVPFNAGLILRDLDANDSIDIVLSACSAIWTILNNGDGTFRGPRIRQITNPDFPCGGDTVCDDFNLDGFPDIAMAYWGRDQILIFLNDGSGQLRSPLSYAVPLGRPQQLKAADLNRDGAPDLACINFFASVSILLNDGTGRLSVPTDYYTGRAAFYGTLIDVVDIDNRDGPDLLVNHAGFGHSFSINRGDGTFEDPMAIGDSNVRTLRVVDLNADALPDLLAASGGIPPGGPVESLQTFMNEGDGDFAGPVSMPVPGLNPWPLIAGDVDGDGAPDVIAGASVFFNDGAGNLCECARQIQIGGLAVFLDLDGDGLGDLLSGRGPQISVWFNRPSTIPAGSSDLNQNSVPDECDSDCDGDGVIQDCNKNGKSDDCDIMVGRSTDADGDNIPDECPKSFRRGDVDGSGAVNVGDVVSIEGALFWGSRLSSLGYCPDAADTNDDGLVGVSDAYRLWNWLFFGNGQQPADPGPFTCGLDPTPLEFGNGCPRYDCSATGELESSRELTLGFSEGNLELAGPPGSLQRVAFFSTLNNTGAGSSPAGWSLSLITENAHIVSATTDGTDAATFQGSFRAAETTTAGTNACEGFDGAVSAFFFGSLLPSLQSNVTYTVARIELEVVIPEEAHIATVRYLDGCKGRSQPVINAVSRMTDFAIETFRPQLRSLEIRLVPRLSSQLPSDANQDSRLDLSDAIWLLGHLFLGTFGALPCEGGTAAAPGPGELQLLDANGDGLIDISDAVRVLGFLFGGAPAPFLGTECVPIAGCPDACRP